MAIELNVPGLVLFDRELNFAHGLSKYDLYLSHSTKVWKFLSLTKFLYIFFQFSNFAFCSMI